MREKIRQLQKNTADACAERVETFLNDISLKRKLALLYLFCVLLPLFLTDGVILTVIVRADRAALKQEMKNTTDAVKYYLDSTMENAVNQTQNIYANRYINEFMDNRYPTPLDYYNAYIGLIRDSLYETSVGKNCVIYADNPDFINGGYFARLDKAKDTVWYRQLQEHGQETLIVPYYEETPGMRKDSQKKLSVIRKMDYYHKGSSGNVLKLDLDYSAMSRSILNARYPFVLYVCYDDKILFSNDGRGGIGKPFELLGDEIKEKAGMRTKLKMYGQTWDIYVMNQNMTAAQAVEENLPLILFLVLVNILLPILLMKGINRSFTSRLHTIGAVFEEQDSDRLMALPEIKGKDEIGTLMRSYNHMAGRINELIQTVYKDRLREQEMDIARQKAELLALHSQINPHFLFNALESIRMHSILKKEYETADMVEKLALMQRQNVEWSRDLVSIADEISFVEAYLELQKYRFGNRLSYRIEVEEGCMAVKLPKLTLVTFVENACVHGMENKAAPGWIFVRGQVRGESLCLEIEDTGAGMSDEQVYSLQERMNHAKIGQLKEKGRVGILNACIRLKMATSDRVSFQLESEWMAGSIITITIPLESLGEEKNGNDTDDGRISGEGKAGDKRC